jgi:hypothetical protein
MATVGGGQSPAGGGASANLQKCGGGGSGHGEAMRGLGKHTRRRSKASHIYLRRLIQRPESPLAPARRGFELFDPLLAPPSTIVTTCTRALRHKANCRQDTHVDSTLILRHLHKQPRTALHALLPTGVIQSSSLQLIKTNKRPCKTNHDVAALTLHSKDQIPLQPARNAASNGVYTRLHSQCVRVCVRLCV